GRARAAQNRSEPGRPRPDRLETPRDHRGRGHPAGRQPHRRQPQRRHPTHPADQRHPTGTGKTRAAPTTSKGRLRRPRLRPRQPSPAGARQRHRYPHRPPRHRTRLRARHLPVGGRANHCPAALVPAPTHPLVDPRRHPRSLHDPGMRDHLLPQTRPMIILLGPLIPRRRPVREGDQPMRTHPSPRRHAALVLGLLCTGALASGCAADFISYELPEEPARYTLEVDSRGGVHTTWEYTSQGVDEDANPDEQPCIGEMFGFQAPDTPCRPEPLIFLQYDLNLALDNTAPAATTHKVTVTAYYQERLDSTPTVTDLQVEASFDDGGTWATVPVRRV